MIARRTLLAGAAAVPLAGRSSSGATAADWPAIEAAARGGTVFWNAWAGDDRTNALIAWVAERLRASHDIAVRHVRLGDASEAVARVGEGAPVDLAWIGRAELLAMRGKLHASVLDRLPNAALVDRVCRPATPAGIAVPWRRAQLVFVHDSARVADPPRSMAALADWAAAHPRRLIHPTARSFLGAAFLGQALVELTPDRDVLLRPAGAAFGRVTGPLWEWYAALRPRLWRRGAAFPESGTAQRTLLSAGEVDIMISFNPSEARTGVANGTLPATARVSGLAGGTIGTCSFNVIPVSAANKPQALVLANFLLSPEAQAHAADPRILGSPTVLALDRLAEADLWRFAAPPDVGVPLPEPHPTWTTRLAASWEGRFAPGARIADA